MNTTPDPPDERINLFHVARQLWRRKFIVILFFAASTAVGFFYLQFASPKFLVTARLLVQRQDPNGEMRSPIRFDPAFMATQGEIVRSRAVVERALESYTPPVPGNDPLAAVHSAIRVTPVEGTNVMQVSYTCSQNEDGMRMLEALVNSYREYLRDAEQDTQLKTLIILTQNEKDIRHELQQEELAYRELRKTSTVVGVAEDTGRVHRDVLANLGRTVTEAKRRRSQIENQSAEWLKSPLFSGQVAANSDFSESLHLHTSLVPSADESSVMSLPSIEQVDQISEIRAIEKQLFSARQWEKELDTLYGHNHPDLRNVRTDIKTRQERLEKLLATIPTVLDGQLQAARDNERELEQLYERELEKARQSDLEILQEQQLLGNIKRLRTVHDSLLTELHSHQLSSDSLSEGEGTVDVKEIESPRSSAKPVWPIPAVVFALCGVVGLCAGSSLAIGIERGSRVSSATQTSGDS